MDLQICAACSSPIPAGSSIKLKTCQHSFCVLCLKYALMYGGTPDLQCPYPLGTFECGAKPNDAEVQYILEYEEEHQDDQQGRDEATGENGGKNEAIGELEKKLDRVLSIDVDEFPEEPREKLASLLQLNMNRVDASVVDSLADYDNDSSTFDHSEEKLAVLQGEQSPDSRELNSKCTSDVDIILSSSGADQFLRSESNVIVESNDISKNEIMFSLNCGSDLLQGTDSENIEIVLNNAIETEANFSSPFENLSPNKDPDETLEATVESSSEPNNGEIPTQSTDGLESSCSEKISSETEEISGESQAPGSDIGTDTSEAKPSSNLESAVPVSVETNLSGEPSTIVKDVSKGAIPKVKKSSGQDSSTNFNSNDSNNTPSNDQPVPSDDQDLALAKKLQEEEAKLDIDLLLAISDANLPPNMEPFECPVCYGQFKPYQGVTLTFCFHSFCKPCLAESVKHSDELEVTCPALVDGNVKCSAIVQNGAIRDLLTEEDFGRFQDRCLQTAEAVIPNTFHCLTPNCRGWVELIGDVEFFECSICLVVNCVSCKAIHGNQSCEDYQANIQRKDDDIKSETTLKTMVETREGMRCPKCGVMITKIAGCDFMTCTTCKTGICWPTRGPRWGPAGQGDISGGCRCKVVNGKRCHPECEGCH